MTEAPRAESPFSESEEQELAAELLAVNNDQELDQFLGGLLRRATAAMGGALAAPVGRVLGGLAKGAVHKVLPGVGRALSAFSGQARPLTGAAARLLGFESEGLSAEDQEFNAATQLVRLTGAAAAQAAGSPSSREPAQVAEQAMIQSARLHAPGLVRSPPHQHDCHDCGCASGGEPCSCRKAASGFWKRRGRHVILQGV